MQIKAKDILQTFAVLSPNKTATLEANRPTLYEEIDQKYANFAGHELICAYTFTEDWSSWEMHPKGDEIVILISGEVSFVLQLGGGEKTIALSHPGSFTVVPKGVWHTAKPRSPSTVLFITPGEGTEHRSV